ncbi:MAG: GAF domain-containing protein [Ferruginibacter sp.]|nr:GAF domain-containing protein [Cytophagales bacterium]
MNPPTTTSAVPETRADTGSGRPFSSSIRGKLIKSFSALGAATTVALAVVLGQTASGVSEGYQVLETHQSVKTHTYALTGGLQHAVAVVGQGTNDANGEWVKQADEVWKQAVRPFSDSIRRNAAAWPEGEKKRLAFQLLDRVGAFRVALDQASGLTQTIALSEAGPAQAFVDSTVRIDASSPGVVRDAVRRSYNPQLAGFAQGELNALHQEIKVLARSLVFVNQRDIDQFEINVENRIAGLKLAAFLLLLGLLAATAVIVRLILKRVGENIGKINGHIRQLADGALPAALEKTDAELRIITDSVNQLTDNLRSIKEFAQHVGGGNFDSDTRVFNDAGELGQSLANMRDGLKQVSEGDKIRYWTNEGLAKFGEILRENDQDLQQLSDHLLVQLVKYLRANQGGVFVVNRQDPQRPFMELTACYAYDRKKYAQKEVLPGQGLVGQTWQEGETIYLREVPPSYVRITSGLGGSTPRYLLIVPLKLSGEVHGVIELASFHDFERHMVEFTEKIAESIASTIAGARGAEQTRQLLQEAQEMTEQMRAQEEEMRQNMEELQATQEEMHRSQRETAEKETNLLALINNTEDGIVAIDRNYVITTINDNYRNRYARTGERYEVNTDVFSVMDEATRQEWKSYYDRAFAGERFTLRKVDEVAGQPTPIEYVINPIRNGGGEVFGVSVFRRVRKPEAENETVNP